MLTKGPHIRSLREPNFHCVELVRTANAQSVDQLSLILTDKGIDISLFEMLFRLCIMTERELRCSTTKIGTSSDLCPT